VRKGDDLTTVTVLKVEKIRSLNLPDYFESQERRGGFCGESAGSFIDEPADVSFMQQQFVVTYSTRQTEILALQDSWVTNTPVKIFYPLKKNYLYIFIKTRHFKSLSVKDRSGFFFLSPVKWCIRGL
jgi:hypothetical protein